MSMIQQGSHKTAAAALSAIFIPVSTGTPAGIENVPAVIIPR